MFGMNSEPVTGSASPPPPQTNPPEPHGFAFAATAAGLFAVWSTIRLLMTRGSESVTMPDFCAYDVALPTGCAGDAAAGVIGCADRKIGVVRRGKVRSALPNVSWPGTRLLNDPSTVRRPMGICGFGAPNRFTWLMPGPRSVPQVGQAGLGGVACAW